MSAATEAASHKETLGFQAEVRQVLNLITHFLYSNKEIFLRELISNASDAADKLRFLAVSDAALYEGDSNLAIRIAFDKDARTITISDNGVGMSREEVIENIGTIAKSGTKRFLASLTGDQAKDANLIGQFGVGFYSAFIVADRVTLHTRRAGLPPAQGVKWESDGEGDFTIETVEKATRGTEITLHLRADEDEFLNAFRLRHIVKTYSDHVAIPILMAPETVAEGADVVEDAVNQASALWLRPKSEITQSEYNEFYKHVSHDFVDPLAHVHARIEGRQEYTLLLYVPARAPFDLFDREPTRGVKLYVKRVFILDDAERLLPRYLRFMRGVIDSSDLPLNVSRELLQHNHILESIKGNAAKRALGLLEEIAEKEPEKYQTFWKEFGRVLKEGVGEDFVNRERIATLLRFATTHTDSEDETVSLADYVSRMKERQAAIYYITAETFISAKNSPHLEIFRKKGLEVLLLTDRVDEWLVTSLPEFSGKKLQSVAKGDLNLDAFDDAAEKRERETLETESRDLVERIKTTLGERVKDVRPTHRLTTSPCCLVSDANDMSGTLERLLAASGQKLPPRRAILEINPGHPLLAAMRRETDDAKFADWSALLFEQAVLSEGGHLDDPAGFVARMNGLLIAFNR
jgi:molecular chaperone HtpG